MFFAKISSFIRSNHRLTGVIIGVLFVFGNLVISNNTRKDGKRYVFWSDGLAYYVYLPSVFIHHDLNTVTYGGVCPKTNKPVNKVTSGVATLQMPFFLMANAVAKISQDKSNGFSETYEFFITMGTITYAYLGLLLTFLVLLRYVRKYAAFLSVLTIYFGTNLYYYTIGESGMSHTYSFFVMSWFVWSLHYFIEKPNINRSLQIGLSIGLAVLIRPTNILILILPFLLGVNNLKELTERVVFFVKSSFTYLSVVFAFLVLVPQLLYWKAQTGGFLYYSYPNETFTFLSSPHVGDVLFGFNAGLFTFSPLLLLFIPGIFVMIKKRFAYTAVAIALIFSVICYLNASWWIPTFDCSFGHRAFIEYFPILAIPIAFVYQSIFIKKKSILVGLFLMLFLFVNIRFAYLYKKYPCWKADYGYNWDWSNVAYVIRVAFFIEPRPAEHFRNINWPK